MTWLVLDPVGVDGLRYRDRRKADVPKASRSRAGSPRPGEAIGSRTVGFGRRGKDSRAAPAGPARLRTRCTGRSTYRPRQRHVARHTRPGRLRRDPAGTDPRRLGLPRAADLAPPAAAARRAPHRDGGRGTGIRVSRCSPTSASSGSSTRPGGTVPRRHGDRRLRERFATAASEERRAFSSSLASPASVTSPSRPRETARPLAAFLRKGTATEMSFTAPILLLPARRADGRDALYVAGRPARRASGRLGAGACSETWCSDRLRGSGICRRCCSSSV